MEKGHFADSVCVSFAIAHSSCIAQAHSSAPNEAVPMYSIVVQLRIELTLLLHEAEDEGPLALVGSDDADLVRPQPGVEERSDGLLHVLRLDSVEEGRAGG